MHAMYLCMHPASSIHSPILQNIAARNPVLSGEVRFLPLDELVESIVAIR
jgi:hypothetical protein